MAVQVQADPNTRVISFIVAPTDGQISVDVASEIYSALKDDWLVSGSLNSLKFPLRPVGGDTISATEQVGKYIFLANDEGWRLQPYDQDHELTLNGNIFPEDPSQLVWLNRAGRTITIQLQRSAQAILASGGSLSRPWVLQI